MTALKNLPLRNVALLRKVRQQINEHPETWDQGSYVKPLMDSIYDRLNQSAAWLRARGLTKTRLVEFQQEVQVGSVECTSAFCVAGWGVVFGRLEIAEPNNDYWSQTDGPTQVSMNGEEVAIEDAAQLLFGLTDEEAVELFDGSNSLGKVNRLLEKYIRQGEQQLAAL